MPSFSRPTTVTDEQKACLKHAAEIGKVAKSAGITEAASTEIVASEYRHCVDHLPKKKDPEKGKS